VSVAQTDAAELTLAQVQFNLFRPHRWVTVGAGTREEVSARAASGYYSKLTSPAGDLPCQVRVHHPSTAFELSAAMADLADAATWSLDG
jgi:hypothetical protein